MCLQEGMVLDRNEVRRNKMQQITVAESIPPTDLEDRCPLCHEQKRAQIMSLESCSRVRKPALHMTICHSP
jgi:queuine/archaeosine tRNA-ribosyltransferase